MVIGRLWYNKHFYNLKSKTISVTSNPSIITLQYSSTLKFFSLGLFILGIGIFAYDFRMESRQVIVLLCTLLSIVIFLFSKTNYKLYADRIICTTYRASTTLHLNSTTLCYEHRPKTTKRGTKKPANEFFIKTKQPQQQFKIYDTSWENYTEFKKEAEKAVKAKVNVESKWQKKMSSKQKEIFHKTFDEKVLTAEKKALTKQKNTYSNVGIGFGAIVLLSGILGLLRIIILRLNFIETVAAEPLLIIIGFSVMVYYAMFSKGYD